MNNKPVHSIADIARLAHVSKSTVSRALNDSPLISQKTKALIHAIALQHNFRINAPARQLSLRQSRSIAFVIQAYHQDFSIADLFILEIMGGIARGLYASGYDMLVIQAEPHETGWTHEYLDSGRVAGFILLNSTWKQQHIQALVEMGAPFIAWGSTPPGSPFCSVSGDNFNGGELAAGYLLDSGRRRIAFIGGPEVELEVQLRMAGYAEALHRAGIGIEPALIAHGDYTLASGSASMQYLLDEAPDLDAVFVTSDLMAVAAMDAIRARNRRVPEDVAVVGYDDLSIAQYTHPPLTTIRQDIPLAGKLLAQNLIQFLKTGVVTNVSIPVELVIRQSA